MKKSLSPIALSPSPQIGSVISDNRNILRVMRLNMFDNDIGYSKTSTTANHGFFIPKFFHFVQDLSKQALLWPRKSFFLFFLKILIK